MQMIALPNGSIKTVDKDGAVKILPPIHRPDGKVIMPIAFLQGGKGNQVSVLRRFAPVVTIEGEVIEEQIDHPNHSGARWVRVIEDVATLTRRARALGHVFYRDMCLGRIDGVEAEPEKWGHWLAVKKMRGAGQVPARGALPMELMYHSECLLRADKNAGGVQRIDEAGIKALLREAGEAVEEDDAERPAAERAMLKTAAKAERKTARG